MEKALSWEAFLLLLRYVKVYPKGLGCSDQFSLFLNVVNPNSLRTGWKRRVVSCFVLLNQSGKVLYTSPNESKCNLFCAEFPNWGYQKTVPLTELQGFLEKNKLIVELYIKVVEVVHQGNSTENDIIDFNGFQITVSHAFAVGKIVLQDPYFVVDFKPENQWVKTKYMYLLGLVETLSKSPQILSATELSNAQSDLTALTEAGFKLDWLNSKLEEVSLEWKKAAPSDGSSQVQQLEERVKNVEFSLSDLIVELHKDKIKSAAAAKVSTFQFVDFLINRLFLCCFSFSKS